MGDRREVPRAYARSLSWAVGGGVLLVLALVVASRRRGHPTLPPHEPLVDAQASCETLHARYRAALAPLAACTRDEECMADRRDGVRSGLEGCARFRRVDAKLSEVVDPLESEWLAGGCAKSFLTCAPRHAQCVSNVCVERPPAPLPRTWRRVQHDSWVGTRFSFFVPPDLVRKEFGGDDGEGGGFVGPRYELVYEYGDYSPSLDAHTDEGETELSREPVLITGVAGNLIVSRTRDGSFRSGIQIPEIPAVGRGKQRLTLWARCKTKSDCADLPLIARSIELH